jgi:mannose-6-phosphate isomerase-like protein (cupin superfamily)
MPATVTRGAVAADKQAAARVLREQGSRPRAWGNGPGDRYAEHEHDYAKVLYCVAGEITFRVGGEDLLLRPGDRLDVQAGTRHAALVGASGVRCVEGGG